MRIPRRFALSGGQVFVYAHIAGEMRGAVTKSSAVDDFLLVDIPHAWGTVRGERGGDP